VLRVARAFETWFEVVWRAGGTRGTP
jgi:hypothetical protein